MTQAFMDVSADSAESDFPAVEAAYSFVIPSYQLLVSRFEAADTRLTSLLTVALTVTSAVPAFAKAVRPSSIAFSNLFFIAAMLCAVVCVGFGICGRLAGTIVLPDPMVIYQKSLRRSSHSFKMSQIYFAGQNFDRNAKAIDIKGTFATVMTVALSVEIVCLVIWLSQ